VHCIVMMKDRIIKLCKFGVCAWLASLLTMMLPLTTIFLMYCKGGSQSSPWSLWLWGKVNAGIVTSHKLEQPPLHSGCPQVAQH